MADGNRLTVVLSDQQYEQLIQLSKLHKISKSTVIRAAAHEMFIKYYDYHKYHFALKNVDRIIAIGELGCSDYNANDSVEDMTKAAIEQTKKYKVFSDNLKRLEDEQKK